MENKFPYKDEVLILKFVSNGRTFLIYTADDFKVTVDEGIEAINCDEDLKVNVYELLEDGTKKKCHKLGESFAGVEYYEVDFTNYVITSYVSNETCSDFFNVHEKIKNLKEEFFKPIEKIDALSGVEREIPGQILNSSFDVLKIDIIYSVENALYAGYIGMDNDSVALVNAYTGELLTDNEDFYANGILSDVENPDFKVIYISDNGLEFFKEFDVKLSKSQFPEGKIGS